MADNNMADNNMADNDAADDDAAASDDCASEDVLCIGLVTDVGEVDDKSFNQSAWEGAEAAAATHGAAKVNYIETQDAKDYAANMQLFLDEGYDILVTVGFAMGEATGIAAGRKPDVFFIGVDQWTTEDSPSNYVGLVFNEDQSGFWLALWPPRCLKPAPSPQFWAPT